MVVCDGLKGLPDTVNAVWEKAVVQTCIVHLLRNSFKYASKLHWAQVAKDLKPVYTAPSEAAAFDAFAEFSGKWEKKYPAIIRLWETPGRNSRRSSSATGKSAQVCCRHPGSRASDRGAGGYAGSCPGSSRRRR